MTTSLINKVEILIKREKTTPEHIKDEPLKSSEVLSELFGAFNADPPKIEEVSTEKSKKSKKKHKEDQKKCSRCSSSSSSVNTEYAHKRKKRKKSKSKQQISRSPTRHHTPPPPQCHSPSNCRSSTPKIKPDPERNTLELALVKPDPELVPVKKELSEDVEVKKEEVKSVLQSDQQREVSVKMEIEDKTEISLSSDVKVKKEEVKSVLQSEQQWEVSVKMEIEDKTEISLSSDVKVKKEEVKSVLQSDQQREVSVKMEIEDKTEISLLSDVKVKKEEFESVLQSEQQWEVSVKMEIEAKTEINVSANMDASLIPMPESPKDFKLELGDLRQKLYSKKSESENDKSKGKIQIKNLKRAEKYEKWEYTDSSNESIKEVVINSQFSKTSDPGGFKKAAEYYKITSYNRTMEKQPDEPEDFTNEPLLSMSEPLEVPDAVASTSTTPFAHPIITVSKSKAQKQREYRQRIAASRTPAQAAAARKLKNERQRKNRLRQAANLAIASGSLEAKTKITTAPKTRAQIQREYRQRIAASKTPAQVAAAREARNLRERNNRLRQAATLAIASGSLKATTTSSSRSGQRLKTVHIDTQRQFTDQQRQTLATEPAETTVQPSTSSDHSKVQAQSTLNTKWASSNMRLKSTFLDNDFSYTCSVCNRLWFRNDLKPITAAQLKVISDWFLKENRQLSREEYKLVCNTCKKSLNKQSMPPLAKVNEFSYPDPPPGLPPLDPISERLISPRLPFMQENVPDAVRLYYILTMKRIRTTEAQF